MIEFRRTRTQRLADDGNTCCIAPAIIAAGISAAGSLLGGSMQKGATKEQEYSPEQQALLFNGPAAPRAPTPQHTAAGLNYLRGLSGGYNPATGPSQGPMGFDAFSQGLAGMDQPGNPVAGLLGWGAGEMPPLFTNSPYFGNNVADPENLQGWPGMEQFQGQWAAQQQGDPASGQGGTTGTIIGGGTGMPWHVRTGGGGLLSLEEATPLVRAGLLSLDNGDAGTLIKAKVLTDASGLSGSGAGGM